MNKQIQTGILAYGMSGKLFHAPFLTTNPYFNLRAVTERTKKEAHSRYADVISYDSVDELLADRDIELVIVNTPNNTHFDFAEKAILAGKHVLIEKPMVATSNEAEHLFELGRVHERRVMVYQNRRWDNDFKMLKAVIDGGKLGDLIEVHLRFDRYRPEIGKKAFKEKLVPASGIAYDLGSHLLDQVISLFGKPDKVLKIGTKNRVNTAIEDYVNFILYYKDGMEVSVTTSYLVADPGPGYIVHGTKGSFVKSRTDVQEEQLLAGILPTDAQYGLDDSEGKLTYFDQYGEKAVEYIVPEKGNYNVLFDSIYAQIRDGVPFPVTEDEILWQLDILELPYWNAL